MMFFCCYYVLLCRADRTTGEPVRPPLAYFAVVLFLLAFFEFIVIQTNAHLHDLSIFRWVSAFSGGVAMALFVGRLEGTRLGALSWSAPVFYFYAVATAGWVLEGDVALPRPFAYVLYSSYLVLKVVLFFLVLWLLQTGRMLYHIYWLRRAGRREDQLRTRFLHDSVIRP